MNTGLRGLRDEPERRRELGLALTALLIFAVVLSLVQYARLRDRQSDDLRTQASIVAQTVSAALVFDSPADAVESLSALAQSPAVLDVRVLYGDGREFTHYSRRVASSGGLAEHAGTVQIEVPVTADGRRVGALQVEASRLPMWVDLLQFLVATFGTLLATAGLAWLFSKRLRAQIKEVERRTRYLARFDALTDLPNREYMRGLLERALQRGHRVTLFFRHLQNYNQINDQYGHAAGDAVLQATAQRLRDLCGPGDEVARLAGDEFALLVNPGLAPEPLRERVQQLQAGLTQPLLHDGHWLHVHFSAGAATLPDQAADPSEAMRCADAAMRHAKSLGKDGFQLFTADIGQALQSRLALENDMRVALAEGQFSLAYQPQYDAERRVQGFEALARWQHPQRGWVSPAEFIPVAESSGLIVDLGLTTLALLRRDLDYWRDRGMLCPTVAINLSWEQCRKPPHRERFLQQLRTLRLGPADVEFELTESVDFEDLDKPDSFIFTLQGLGYGLAIDDFGTGYSSLAYLRRFRCRKLKIDRLFVHGMSANADSRMLVESMVRVAHAMRMVVVAEGVETPADEAALVAMGCDLMQGFGFCRPVPADEVPTLLSSAWQATQPG